MASKAIKLCAVVVLVGMLCDGATAQSGCTSALVGLSPCLNYVSGNSSTPSSSCCSQLASIVQSQPQCLCTLVNGGGGSSLGISINQTLALALPAACNVQTPPASRCNAGTSPTSSPPNDTPQTPTTPSVPSTTTTPAGGGSKTVPTTGGISGGSVTRIQLHLTLFIIFIASCASYAISY